ncbi:FAD-dependent oxidoreductase, partial [Actinoplanes sp. NPDC051633]|uniref:FAD-dependent oxidoreductase n=1 Tax=Actinoplanes sp. NPDC051633 TaxID=3155670 RepID=UPI00343EC52E
DPYSFHFGERKTCVVEPDGGLLLPSRCLDALCRRAQELGVRLENGEVRSATSVGKAVNLRVDNESVHMDRVVVAAGPWTADLLPGLQPKLRVTRQYPVWLAAEPIGDGACQPWIDLDNGYYGVVNAAPGRHLIARHIGGSDTEVDYGIRGSGCGPDGPVDPEMKKLAAADGIRQFAGMFKPSAAAEVVDVDVCHYTNTQSGQFIVDRSPDAPNIVSLSACSGQGFKFAPVSGAHAAALADDLDLPPAAEESSTASSSWPSTEAM